MVAAALFAAVAPAQAALYRAQDLLGGYQNTSQYCAKEQRFSGLVPCGRHCDNPATPGNETDPCSVCHLIVLGNNIMRYITYIAVFIALAVIVFAGVMYIVSAGDEGTIGLAKSAFKAALFGITFILIAWVIVNTLLTKIIPLRDGALKGNWSSYYCERSWVNPASSGSSSGGTNVPIPPTGGGTNVPNPSTGGGTNVPNPSGGSAQGSSSRIPDVTQHAGTMYCAIDTPQGADGAVMVADACYTSKRECDQRHTQQVTGANGVIVATYDCQAFAGGSVSQVKKYDVFRYMARARAVESTSGVETDFIVGGDNLNFTTMEECVASLETNKANYPNLEVVYECIGKFN